MTISIEVMLGEVPKLCLLVATLAFGSDGGAVCQRGKSWWDRERGACVPCTVCDPKTFAVKRPCDVNSDTVCQYLHEVRIGLFHKDNEASDYDYYDYTDVGEVSDDGEVKWDLQVTALVLAASGCVVFFVVVLYLTFHHSKQWKALKMALRSDVQDLSAKLKLMEAGETPAEPAPPADHIYSNIHVTKDGLLGPASNKKGFGNVYTQEKHSS